ncbi:MAG TPA: c-type cytochrome [Candidatus Acidoferrales bacterium]|nr:c-type cytochrome [Candidatus Acidoferrales bacterium]
MNVVKYVRLVALVFVAGILTSNAFCIPRAIGQESQPAQQSPTAKAPPADAEQGKRLFGQNCSACHGADAGGGDGPDLRGVPASLGDATVQGIVRRGIPGTAMPGNYTITDKEAGNIVAYLRTLDSATSSAQATGDAKKGEALYNSSGCSACHMIAGQGGSIGPDLSRIGAMRGASSLKARLQDPGANLPQVGEGGFGSKWTQYLMYRAVEKDGRAVEGVRVGEDSFTIVLKDAGGKFHGLWKPDLRSLEKETGKSFMPSFKDTLSATQQDDLVAYLMSLKGAQ